MKKMILGTLCFLTGALVIAQENIQPEPLDSVLIATKTKVAKKNLGKIITKITSETLEKNSVRSLAEVINEVSGIEINGSRSNDGQNLGYFVRGGRNRQVVIMIDGVQLNDPSSIANDFDLRLLSTDAVKEIEIIKGASSVLYGSGAGTAVISITTKEATDKAISGTFRSSFETNNSADEETNGGVVITNNAFINGTAGKFFYAADFSHRYADGLSAISAPEGEEPFEEDTFDRFNTKLNLGYKFSDKVTVSRFVAVDDYKGEFDDFSFTDVDNQSRSSILRTGGSFEWKYNKGKLVINDNHSWIDREFASSFPSMSDAKSSTFDAFGTYKVSSQLTVLAGVNGNFSSYNAFSIPFGATEFNQDVNEDVAKFDIIDPYLNLTYISDFGLNVNAGARLNNHSNYGTHLVYNINPSYNFTLGENTLKVLGSYSTAYITPSLFQLFEPSFGNQELEPEENTTIEGGLSFSLKNVFNISAVYFTRNEKNFVDFVTVDPDLFIFEYQNIADEFDASGVEVELSVKATEDLSIFANYTNTQADERFALRIPEHKANARVNYNLGDKTNFGLAAQYVSDRDDNFFDPANFESTATVLDSFTLVNFNASHQFSDVITAYAGVDNILNEEYEEVFRFQTKGRNFRLGFQLKF